MADIPVMFYAGIGYTERFPDYWELFSPTYGPGGSGDAFDKLKTEKTTQIDIGAQYNGERINTWISAYIGRVNDFILFRYDPDNASISQVDNVNATIMGERQVLRINGQTHGKRMPALLIPGGKYIQPSAFTTDATA